MRPRTLVALLLTLPAHANAQDPAAPSFGPGDLTALSCRVTAATATDADHQILTVEVGNRGPVAAEPLLFELEVPPGKDEAPTVETFARVQLPHVARYGRPVPANGKQTYRVATSLRARRGQLTVRVAAASFVDGGVVAEPDLDFGPLELVQRESLVGRFPVTKVTIRNPLDHDLDVLMLVDFEQPKNLTDLVGVRLPARAARDLVLATRPGPSAYVDQTVEAPASTVKAVRFQLVDWSLVGALPPEAGAALLRPAYEAWYRWPALDDAVGEFTLRERRARPGTVDQYEDFRAEGRFSVAGNRVQLEITDGHGANASLLLRDALSNVRRPDFATLSRASRLVPVASDRVALIGPGWSVFDLDGARHRVDGSVKPEECPDVQVLGTRIVSEGQGPGARIAWETQGVDGARLVTRRVGASLDTRYAYATVEGRIVPSGVAQVVQYGARPFSSSELTLRAWTFAPGVALAPARPTGDGADGLRALWDASYRLPVEPIPIEAKFTITTDNDGVWRGHRKLSGTVVLEGIGRHLRGSDFRFDETLAREDEVQLAAVVRDRLLMWYGRDFNDRPTFDEFFGDAVVHAPDAGGTYRVERGRVQRVFTRDGLVRGFGYEGGGTMRFVYGRVGSRLVVTRIDEQSEWDAATSVTLVPVGPHLLPTKLVFEHIFGRDWKPETIVFRDVRLK